MASYHRVLKAFGRSIEDEALQCDWYANPFPQITLRIQDFIEGLSSTKSEDDQHISKLLDLVGKEFKDGKLIPKTASSEVDLSNPDTNQAPNPIYKIFTRDSADYTTSSIGHPIGLCTKYSSATLEIHTIHLRKPSDPLLKQKYKRALKVHDTLDMIQDAVKLGLVSYAEILGQRIGYIGRGSSTLDIGKGFVGGLGAGNESPGWVGLSGDRG
ncbi:hypothetical protein EAF00_007251 [Botryotinia globosa]|nr:hypothetical protein EAF00_007251 [Botryotinia globosa]